MHAQDAREIAWVIRNGGIPSAIVLMMGRQFSVEAAQVVMDQLLDLMLPEETDLEKRARQALTMLEKFGDTCPDQALLLMKALKSRVEDPCVPDVWEWIDRWEDELPGRFTIALRGVPAFCGRAEVGAHPEDAEGAEDEEDVEDVEMTIINLLHIMCSELDFTHRAVLEIKGCGVEWRTGVWVELSIMLEQLPRILPALRVGRRTCLDFFEQGFQRIVWLEPAHQAAHCLDRATHKELGQSHLAVGELLESLHTLLVDFVSYAWMAFPEEASHPLFVEWQNACLPEAG